MAKYRRKPTIIEAEQLTREHIEGHLFDGMPLPRGVFLRAADYNVSRRTIASVECDVKTIHGHRAQIICGEWIMPEPDGEHFYPCADAVFRATYEPVEETER